MIGIVVFPGSNCEYDCYHVVKEVLKTDGCFIWHKERHIDSSIKALILPGGFSFGDYLRTGAIARFSPVIDAVSQFAAEGKLVLGICNGFQILLEAGLLPGAMLKNKNLKYICKDVYLKINKKSTSPFISEYKGRDVVKIPIAHGEGNYYAYPDTLKALHDENSIVFRYCTADGQVTDDVNPNGSVENIAGIANANGNVLGMMPHPERCSEDILGNRDGLAIFESMVKAIRQAAL
ncbi:MAG: phosphoribosylformylglycinamidine synthase subunit PurQ [Candidatus Magnetoovum sp. WYHC-5]|nr:phosphoribosylformylglycinamidine synthase subunit PurQ [Candidatus Magnetoovum sp. WYHC-5]